jgi:hypothetical protein
MGPVNDEGSVAAVMQHFGYQSHLDFGETTHASDKRPARTKRHLTARG